MPARTPAIADAAERVGQTILVIRRQRVLIDKHLAALYGVETRGLLQGVAMLSSVLNSEREQLVSHRVVERRSTWRSVGSRESRLTP
jgi:hypothetical protein